MFDKYPYTNFHEMNLDWIIKEMKNLVDAWEGFSGKVSADAHASTDPEVTVTGDLKEGLFFDFGLVQGPRGITGPQGPQGEQGPAGNGLEIMDIYPTLAALQAAHPTGSPGDAYLVGSSGSYTLYIWSSSSNAWSDGGSLTSPSPSSTAPAMNGVAAAGSSLLYSRGDHVHPADTSKLDKSSSNGVYAVQSGAQVMLNVSDNAAADSLVMYDSVGDLNANDINASGTISADDIFVTNSAILNSGRVNAIASNAAYRTLSKNGNIDPLYLEPVDLLTDSSPNITFKAIEYASDGTATAVSNSAPFSTSFVLNDTDYSERRIGLAPASASVLGGVKIGSGISVASDGTISANYAGSEFVLLWTNASPTTDFGAQTISIDLSDYAAILVETNEHTSNTNRTSNLMLVNGDTYYMHTDSSTFQFRLATVNTTGITFGQGNIVSTYGAAGTVQNSRVIPEYIYGLK